MLGAACSVQGGAAVAKTLFPKLGPPGVVFLRLLFGSLALWAIARPQIRGRRRADLQLLGALGVVLVSMNISFYEALDRAPLGVVVTVEFLGPLAVAVLCSRRRVDLVWVALAAAGVALLADGGGRRVQAAGIVLAAVAGLFWALYILLSVRVGRVWRGASGLAPAMVARRAADRAPWGIISAGHHLGDAQLVGAAVGVGLLSSALPWSLELEALRRLPPQSSASCWPRARGRGARRLRLPARASAHTGVARDRARRARERRRCGAPALELFHGISRTGYSAITTGTGAGEGTASGVRASTANDASTTGPTRSAKRMVPTPNVPPSTMPTASAQSSSVARTIPTRKPVRRAPTSISVSRGPAPRSAPM